MIARHDKVQRYCSEPISSVENYNEAVNSDGRWDCHHKDEIDLNATRIQLIKLGKYYKVPAERLIFLPVKEHISLHMTQKDSHIQGKNNYQWHDICPLQLFYYRNVKKMSYEKIAEIFNCSIATIHRRLSKINNSKNKNITI